jgi:hypothetical protein
MIVVTIRASATRGKSALAHVIAQHLANLGLEVVVQDEDFPVRTLEVATRALKSACQIRDEDRQILIQTQQCKRSEVPLRLADVLLSGAGNPIVFKAE